MDVIMPQLGETVTEGTVTRWYKKVGDTVKADETLFDIETDKVSTEVPAPASGVIAEILIAEGVTAKVGARLAVIREAGSAPHESSGSTGVPAAAPITEETDSTSAVRARVVSREGGEFPARGTRPEAGDRLSPVVRRLIAEHDLDPAKIAGTGRDGRITREDVYAHVAQRSAQPAARQTLAFNSVRRRVAENMAKSWQTTPHVMQVVEADFHRVEQARRTHGAEWKRANGYSLTYLPFIVRAVSMALGKFPKLNASLAGDGLVLHPAINIGIAVDLDLDGLLVPVVRNVEAKSLPQIAEAINDLAHRARAGRLKPDDMTGGTYTITNNGAFGTVITAPIINPPQVAILSADSIRKKPVVVEAPEGDSIAIRPVGVLAQSFDHRAVDGSYSASFLQEVKQAIETQDWEQALSA